MKIIEIKWRCFPSRISKFRRNISDQEDGCYLLFLLFLSLYRWRGEGIDAPATPCARARARSELIKRRAPHLSARQQRSERSVVPSVCRWVPPRFKQLFGSTVGPVRTGSAARPAGRWGSGVEMWGIWVGLSLRSIRNSRFSPNLGVKTWSGMKFWCLIRSRIRVWLSKCGFSLPQVFRSGESCRWGLQVRFYRSSTAMEGLMLSLGLMVLACSPRVEPRVRLNSIRTVVLRDGPAVPANGSSWETSEDLKVRDPRLHLNGSKRVSGPERRQKVLNVQTEIHVRVWDENFKC